MSRLQSLAQIVTALVVMASVCRAEPGKLEYLPVLGADLPILSDAELRAFHHPRQIPEESGKKKIEGQEEYLLREIVALQNADESDENFAQRVAQLTDRLSAEPDSFVQVARELSASPTRRKGGLLTPMTLNQLEAAQQETIRKLKPGEISGPITVPGGVILYRREELRLPEKGPE